MTISSYSSYDHYLSLIKLMYLLNTPFDVRMSYNDFVIYKMRVHISEINKK